MNSTPSVPGGERALATEMHQAGASHQGGTLWGQGGGREGPQTRRGSLFGGRVKQGWGRGAGGLEMAQNNGTTCPVAGSEVGLVGKDGLAGG